MIKRLGRLIYHVPRGILEILYHLLRYTTKRVYYSDKFFLTLTALLGLGILDFYLIDQPLLGELSTTLSQHEAFATVVLSLLLVLLYYNQHKIQTEQKTIMDRQNELSHAQHKPLLLIDQITADGNTLQIMMENIGNGPAINTGYIIHCDRSLPNDPRPEPLKNDEGTTHIHSSEDSKFFQGEMKIWRFPPTVKAKQYDYISDGILTDRYDSSFATIVLTYQDVTGVKEYVDLCRINGRISEYSTFEEAIEEEGLSIIVDHDHVIVRTAFIEEAPMA